jgi:hypothetical protein
MLSGERPQDWRADSGNVHEVTTERVAVTLASSMPPRLPVLRPREVVAALLRAGFYIDHQTGSHARFYTARAPIFT